MITIHVSHHHCNILSFPSPRPFEYLMGCNCFVIAAKEVPPKSLHVAVEIVALLIFQYVLFIDPLSRYWGSFF